MNPGSGAAIGQEAPASEAAHQAAGHPYRPEVDGLRALAVIPVILFHAGFTAFAGGYVGVDVFFVISGYLITSIILREQISGRFTFAAFYERRARRILPALFLVMALCFPFAWFLMLPSELEAFGQSVAAVTVFASNVLFWQTSGYFGGAAELKPLLHTWSLGIEEQYYLFFPIALAFLLRLGLRRTTAIVAVAAAASFAISLALVARAPTANFFLLPSRAWELLAGSLLALGMGGTGGIPTVGRLTREILSLAGLALIILPILTYDAATPFPGLAAAPPVIGSMLVLAFAHPVTLCGRILTLRPMLWIGAISYSAYLWHQPLFAFARLASPDEVSPLAYLGLIAATLGLAHLSWKYVEAPFRDRRRFSRRWIFAGAAAASMAALVAGLGLWMSNGTPARFPTSARPLLTPPGTEIQSCPQDEDGLFACRLGNPSAPTTVVLLGDSHAYALASELDDELKRRGRSGLLLYTGCHPIPGVYETREPPTPARVSRCEAANARLIARATGSEIRSIIVAIRWTLRLTPVPGAETTAFDNHEGGVEADSPARRNFVRASDGAPDETEDGKAAALRGYLSTLAARKPTTIVYPAPEVGWLPPRLALLSLRGLRGQEDVSTSSEVFRTRNAAAIRILDSVEGPSIRRVRPSDLLCDTFRPGRCVAQHGGTSFYSDDDHLSSVGAKWVVNRALGPSN